MLSRSMVDEIKSEEQRWLGKEGGSGFQVAFNMGLAHAYERTLALLDERVGAWGGMPA